MSTPSVCILGGSGFVGYHLANQLARAGYRVRIPTRRRERHRDFLVMPTVDVINADIHQPEQLERLFSGCQAVINLTGILNESRRNDFTKVHVTLTEKCVNACIKTGVKRLLHMSALNADATRGASKYLRTKGEGEDFAHNATPLAVTSFRPSVIFGPGDSFFSRFDRLLRISPVFFPLACADAKFAPIYVEDVCALMVDALKNPTTIGRRLEACGPRAYTLLELVEYVNKVSGLNRSILPLGDAASRFLAALMGSLPGKVLTTDNYLSSKVESICSSRTLILGKPATPIEAVVPLYLGKKSQRGNYGTHRGAARRNGGNT